MNKLFLLAACAIFMAVNLFGQVSVKNTKHNLSVSGPGTVKAESEQAICIFCHTPHRSTADAQLWNRQPTSASYTLYTSNYLTSKSYVSPNQPNAKSKLCLSCHDGTIALGSIYNTTGSGTSSPVPMAGGVTTMPTGASGHLDIALTDDHPVGYSYVNASDPELVVRGWPWNGNVTLDPNTSEGKVECHTCHNSHDNQWGYFLRTDNTDAALCTTCHNKSNWSTAVHNSSVQNYTPPGGTATTIGEWACRNCHKAHGGTGAPYILKLSEENTCYESSCHGTVPSPTTSDIKTQLDKTYAHPTNIESGKHKNPDTQATLADRHAECQDCHNPHQATGVTHDGTTRTPSGVLRGTWGVDLPTWPAAPTNMISNDTSFTYPLSTDFVVQNPATGEYQICMKCHSDYTTQLLGKHNIAAEINPNNASYHGIVPGGASNPYCDQTTMNEPWGTNKIVWCSDCHGSDSGGDPQGPHGSNLDNILVASVTSDASNGTPLCFVCHKISNYWDGQTRTRYDQHPGSRGGHKKPQGCFSCHMYDFSDFGGSTGGNSRSIFIHGQNKRFYWRETGSGVPGYNQLADAFINGYIADIDFQGQQCFSENERNLESGDNCGRSHSAQTYSIDP